MLTFLISGSLSDFTKSLGPVSRKPRKLSKPAKLFLVNRYLTLLLKLHVWGEYSVYIRIWASIKQFLSHKVWDLAVAFRVRTLFGTFGQRAPGQLYFFPYGVELNFSFPREALSPARKCNEFAGNCDQLTELSEQYWWRFKASTFSESSAPRGHAPRGHTPRKTNLQETLVIG